MTSMCEIELTLADLMQALDLLLIPDAYAQNRQKDASAIDAIIKHLHQNLITFHTHLCENKFQHLKSYLDAKDKYPSQLSETNIDVQWGFVTTILKLLSLLCSLLNEFSSNMSAVEVDKGDENKQRKDVPPILKHALSIGQISTIRTALQFVVCFGLSPNLMPGVGIPIQHRSKLSVLLNSCPNSFSTDLLTPENKQQRLYFCVFMLIALLDHADLQTVVLSVHLNDILSGLLQLLFAPVMDSDKLPSFTKTASSQEECDKGHGSSPGKTAALSRRAEFSCVANTHLDENFGTNTTHNRELKEDQGSKHSTDINSFCLNAENKNYEMKSCCTLIANARIWELPVNLEHCRSALDRVLSSVRPDLLIRELMVLQNGVPPQFQSARSHISSSDDPKTTASPPQWLRKACNNIIVQILLQPKGIQHLYAAMNLGGDFASPCQWKHCAAVAKVVAHCPVQPQKVQHYVENVSRQLLEMLHIHDKNAASFIRVIGSVASEMLTVRPQHFHQYFFHSLLQPLYACLPSASMGREVGVIVVHETDLTTCLEDMHKIYLLGQQPQAGILSTLEPIIGILWTLLCLTYTGVSRIKRIIRELVSGYVKHIGHTQAAVFLRQVCISSQPLTVCFEMGSNGGMRVVQADETNATNISEEQQVEAALLILQDVKADGVAGELLVTLLKELTEIITMETQQKEVLLPVHLERCDIMEKKKEDLTKRVTLLHLLAAICETFGSECLTNTNQTLLFVKASLERGVAVCCNTAESNLLMFETETMSMAMGLLTAVMAGAIEIETDSRALLDEMMPLLRIIGQDHPDEFIKEMATDIRIAIATRGAVWPSLHHSKNKEKGNLDSNKKISELKMPSEINPPSKCLIEVLPDVPCNTVVTTKDSNVNAFPSKPLIESASISAARDLQGLSSQMRQSVKTETHSSHFSHSTTSSENIIQADVSYVLPKPIESLLQQVFQQLCDPLIPVRGHALIELGKLVQKRETETLSKIEVVQKIFRENLHHGDSYIYLAAIHGLSALADYSPESIIPTLAEEFAGFSKPGSQGNEQHIPAEHRLKLGEVLMKATRNLGEMIPKYRETLLAAALRGAQDKDPVVCASSISNLAELCHLLHFSLGPVLHEVFCCCTSVLVGGETIVRQAATLTLAKILEGLDKDAFEVLGSVLKDLYRLLKKLHECDSDDAVRLHANMALMQLDTLARNFLFPKQTLQKKIQVLTNKDTFK